MKEKTTHNEFDSNMLTDFVKRILASNVYDVASISPLDKAFFLSQKLDNNVLLKREDLQSIFSFKVRGAYNRMSQLTPKELATGVITASAGNHAQGVALVAQKLQTTANIVMGNNTPRIKIEQVKRLGAKIILHGDTYNEAAEHAKKISIEQNITYIHPYDDLEVAAGQGTIAVEIMQQHSQDIHAIFVPVGGGGLISGIGAYVRYIRPNIRIIGVEAAGSASMTEALRTNTRVSLSVATMDLFADGVAISQAGEHTFPIARAVVDEMIVISVDEMCSAIKDIYEDTRVITEPAGALAVAGLKKYVSQNQISNQTLIAINSGANVNFDRIQHIAERAEIGECSETILNITIPERAGSFLGVCRAIGNRGITEFNYRFSNQENAQLFIGIQATSNEDTANLINNLINYGYQVLDMSNNEMAKLHIRYMVGGAIKANLHNSVANEFIYRFEFPERPEALLKFLEQLDQKWNISLFHYRNHGSAYGRILIGFLIDPVDRIQLLDRFSQIGYRFWEETNNSAYQKFLL